MWRRLVAALVLAGGAVSCVSTDHGLGVPLPDEAYRPRRSQKGTVDRWRAPPPGRRPTPNAVAAWFPRNRKISRRWTHLVIHHSATSRGGARTFDKHHRQNNGWDELGYHFVIGNGTDTPDGYVEVGSRWHKQKHGAHCKTPDNYYNEHGIGVCLVGDFTKSNPTARQLASLGRLARFLCSRCGIPKNRVMTHRLLTGRTQCPGPRFSLGQLRRALGVSATAASAR